MYISFIYKDVQYCGIAIKIIYEKIQPYLLYIDVNLFPRITKIRHLKKLTDSKDQEITEEELIKKLSHITFDGKLFSFEGSQFLDPIKKNINTHIEFLRNERDKNTSFDLKNFDGKLKI
jgi:hypothetical protein